MKLSKYVGAFPADNRSHMDDYPLIIRVFRRKEDGELFGYEFAESEGDIDSNGFQHGYEFDIPSDFNWNEDYLPSAYVLLPVTPFTITGYTTNPAN